MTANPILSATTALATLNALDSQRQADRTTLQMMLDDRRAQVDRALYAALTANPPEVEAIMAAGRDAAALIAIRICHDRVIADGDAAARDAAAVAGASAYKQLAADLTAKVGVVKKQPRTDEGDQWCVDVANAVHGWEAGSDPRSVLATLVDLAAATPEPPTPTGILSIPTD